MLKLIRVSSRTELLERMREVPLLQDNSIRPYANATITIEEFDPRELYPTTYYLLKSQLECLARLKDALKRFEIDLFELDRWIIFKFEGEQRSLIPIIVEHDPIADVDLIADGAHRAYLSRQANCEIAAVYVTGVDYDIYPFYAYPNSWEEVKIHENMSRVGQKKKYRKENPYDLYRFYDAVFPGIGKPRK